MSQGGGGHRAAKSSSALTEGASPAARVSISQLNSEQFIVWKVALVAWDVQEPKGLRFWEMEDIRFEPLVMFPTN